MSTDPPDAGPADVPSATPEEQLFRRPFLELVDELADPARTDPQTLLALGALARRIMDDAKVMTWRAFKLGQTRELYDATLRVFQRQGNAMARDGKLRTAYAIQILAMSLIARTQQGHEVATADARLDAIIDATAGASGARGPERVN